MLPGHNSTFVDNSDEKGINVNELDPDGNAALYYACYSGQLDIVKLLVEYYEERKIDISQKNNQGFTPLQIACVEQKLDVAVYLLERYPQEINVLGPIDMHLLHYLCQEGNLEFLKYIINNPNFDIDFNVVDYYGDTPLHVTLDKSKL